MTAGRLFRRLLLGVVVLVVCLTPARPESSDRVGAWDERPANADAISVARALSAWLPRKLQASSVPGAAWIVADRDAILSEEVFGHTDGDGSAEITPETVFCIRSISKSVTALAVLIAVQDGLLDLDTPIGIYLPEFTLHTRFAPHPERRITLRHMLSHWAGFTHDPPLGIDLNRPGYFDRYVARISDTWLRFPVGYRHQYSNYGYDLAAHLIEVRSGISFAEYARQKVLLPLGMTRSTFDLDRAAEIEDRATGHDRRGRTVPLRFPEIAAAGLYASARDMARYMQFQLNGGKVDGRRLLRQDLMQEYQAIQFPSIGQRTGYTLGWIREVVSDTFGLYHEGGGRGFASHLILYPELGFGVALLTNRESNGLTGYAGRVVMNGPLVDRYGDLLVADARLTRMDPVADDDPRVAAILGRYGDSPGIVLDFDEGTLGLEMVDDRFVPASLYDDGGQLVAMYEGVKEARFLPPLGNQPGSAMFVDRTFSNDNYTYLEFNDSPKDVAGPDKPEWKAFVGEYEILWAGEPLSAARIEIRNGWLYFRDGKCREHGPGLFFRYDGETLDLRSDPPSFANLELRKMPD